LALGNRIAGISSCFESSAAQKQDFNGSTGALRQSVEDRESVTGTSGFQQQPGDLYAFFGRCIFRQTARFRKRVLLLLLTDPPVEVRIRSQFRVISYAKFRWNPARILRDATAKYCNARVGSSMFTATRAARSHTR